MMMTNMTRAITPESSLFSFLPMTCLTWLTLDATGKVIQRIPHVLSFRDLLVPLRCLTLCRSYFLILYLLDY